MKPRKFIYREYGFFGIHYLIEWVNTRLRAQRQYRAFVPENCDEAVLKVDVPTWSEFQNQVSALELFPFEPHDVPVCDGLQVECQITFNWRLIKFEQSDPEFRGLEELQ